MIQRKKFLSVGCTLTCTEVKAKKKYDEQSYNFKVKKKWKNFYSKLTMRNLKKKDY